MQTSRRCRAARLQLGASAAQHGIPSAQPALHLMHAESAHMHGRANMRAPAHPEARRQRLAWRLRAEALLRLLRLGQAAQV